MSIIYSRREFIRACAVCGLGFATGARIAGAQRAPPPENQAAPLHEAYCWEPLANGRTRCTTCPNGCERAEGEITRCRARINQGGKLCSRTYGKPCVIYIDPLAKNPLYHVNPGHNALATATAGCNLSCRYCQNWEISQVGPDKTRNMDLPPSALVAEACERGLKWLTFSYTEVAAYYEYAVDAARVARSRGLKVAMVTAGFINPKPLSRLIEVSDAFSITLKGDAAFYRDICGGNLDDVWRSIKTVAQSGKWMEVVNLVVPGLNDEESGLRNIARSLAQLNPDIPLHFLRFAPAYKLKLLPSTPLRTLEKARDAARREGLHFVYLSNLPGHSGANTYCPACARLLVERVGFKILNNHVTAGRCPACKCKIPGLDWT